MEIDAALIFIKIGSTDGVLSVRLVDMEWTVLEPVPLNTMGDFATASVTVPYISVTESLDAFIFQQKMEVTTHGSM